MLILPIISILIIYIDVNMIAESMGIIWGKDRTMTMLYSISINTLIVLSANEVLSLFCKINFKSVALLWLIVDLGAFLVFTIIIRKRKIMLSELKHLFLFSKSCFSSVTIILIVICGTVVYMALMTVPYNWDSMTYHLTRIAHWAQNGSIAHYACHDLSQISGPPLAEFVNLHVYILSGNTDYFVNLMQAFSFVISVFLVYKISEITKCKKLFGSLAALVFATTPIVFGEALSTQVDMYSAMWVLIFVYIVLHYTDIRNKLSWNRTMVCRLILLGISAGFCYLAKPSVCIGAIIFAVWLLFVCIRRKDNAWIVIMSVFITGLTALIVALPEMMRNFVTFHSAVENTEFLVESWDIRYLMENMIQNIGFNLPNEYLEVSDFINRVVAKSASILYAGQVPDSLLNFQLNEFNLGQDTALAPIITWLMIFAILCGLVVVIYRLIRKNEDLKQDFSLGYIIAGMGSMLAFCAVARWYKFIVRYEVGYFALLAPAVMLVFQYVFSKRKQLAYAFAGIIVFISILSFNNLVQHHKHYLVSGENRMLQYFSVRGIYEPYMLVSDAIIENGYQNVGFVCGVDSYEYPLWKKMENFISRFEHVCVTNETEVFDDENFLPECIIVVDVESGDIMEYHNISYELTMDAAGVRLFERK